MADKIIVLTKRPAKILKVYDIDLENVTPLEKRSNLKFNKYFEMIWDDLS